MKTSKQQDTTIDSLIVTHRELTCVDVVSYYVYGYGSGVASLKINSGEYWYAYMIAVNGAITKTQKGGKDVECRPLVYLTTN